MTAEVVKMKLKDLRPCEYNPRQMSVRAYKAMGASISKFGLLLPIVWNKRTGNIVGGHQRHRYLTERGIEEADVVVVDLDDKKEAALNLTLNNRFVRGTFSPEVASLLRILESRLGDAFGDIGLDSLLAKYDKAEDIVKPDEPPEVDLPPEKKEPSGEGDGQRVKTTMPLIKCPSCGGTFSLDGEEAKNAQEA